MMGHKSAAARAEPREVVATQSREKNFDLAVTGSRRALRRRKRYPTVLDNV
jgi:hypothetical protein